jgi:AcrR family transcriptional regulator
MTSSALYRYFESRDQLIDALCLDSFASLADALEQAERGSSKNGRKSAAPPAGDFLKVVRAYRRWALEHPTEYTLVFGAGVRTFGPEAKEEMERGVAVLFRAMKRGLEVGQVRPAPLAPTAGRKLRSKLSRWANDMGGELAPEALAACMFVWTQLHGAISLELFGHIPEQLMPADDLFDHLMHEVLRQLGCPVEAGGSRGPR